jgi:hypothetical protein
MVRRATTSQRHDQILHAPWTNRNQAIAASFPQPWAPTFSRAVRPDRHIKRLIRLAPRGVNPLPDFSSATRLL